MPLVITPFKNPSGKEVFRVQGMHNGEFVRKNFKVEAEAITYKQNLEREAANLAPLPAVTTRLTSEQCAEAEHCYRSLDGKMSLTFAVNYALKNYNASAKQITVSKAYDLFLTEKHNANKRSAHIRTLKTRLKPLVTKHGAALANEISADILRPLIFREGSGKVNQENDYRAFSNLFNWLKNQDYITVSPLDKITKIKLDRLEPEILQLHNVRALVNAAQSFKDGALVPYVALALFCAIRPTEIQRLTWDNIDTAAGTVTIGSKIAKMRGRRVVKIPDNALLFLLDHATEKTALFPSNWRKDFDKIKVSAGYGTPTKKQPDLKPWPPDVLRHTGISHHLAKHEHEGKTAAWAGNSPDIVQKHYKGLVKPTECAEFWAIVPGQSVIVKLPAPEPKLAKAAGE